MRVYRTTYNSRPVVMVRYGETYYGGGEMFSVEVMADDVTEVQEVGYDDLTPAEREDLTYLLFREWRKSKDESNF